MAVPLRSTAAVAGSLGPARLGISRARSQAGGFTGGVRVSFVGLLLVGGPDRPFAHVASAFGRHGWEG